MCVGTEGLAPASVSAHILLPMWSSNPCAESCQWPIQPGWGLTSIAAPVCSQPAAWSPARWVPSPASATQHLPTSTWRQPETGETDGSRDREVHQEKAERQWVWSSPQPASSSRPVLLAAWHSWLSISTNCATAPLYTPRRPSKTPACPAPPTPTARTEIQDRPNRNMAPHHSHWLGTTTNTAPPGYTEFLTVYGFRGGPYINLFNISSSWWGINSTLTSDAKWLYKLWPNGFMWWLLPDWTKLNQQHQITNTLLDRTQRNLRQWHSGEGKK